MYKIIIAVLVGIIIVMGWFLFSENNQKVSLSITANKETDEATVTDAKVPDGYLRYVDTDLGFSFDYPETWGSVQKSVFRSSEQDHFNLGFSNFGSFVAYKGANYSALGRGAYWGDFTDVSISEVCKYSGNDCSAEKTESGITVQTISSVPNHCDVAGAERTVTYLLPSQNDELQPWIVFYDGLANEGCMNRDTALAQDFANMVKTITRVGE